VSKVMTHPYSRGCAVALGSNTSEVSKANLRSTAH